MGNPYASVSAHDARRRPPLPAAVRAPGPGFHHLAQPGADGFDAHRPGGSRPRLPETGGLLRRACRRRGRADRHRWLRPQRGRLAGTLRRQTVLALGSGPAPAGHPRRPRTGREDLPATAACRPLRLPPAAGGAVEAEVADQPVHPARPVRARGGAADQCLRQRRRARARSRLRRRGGDGFGRLSDQPVHRPAQQQTPGRLGWQCGKAHALRAGDRAAGARGLRPGLHPHLPALAAGPGGGRQCLGRDRGPGPGGGGGRGDDNQFGHRLARGAGADHRHFGAARRLCRHHRAPEAARGRAAGGGQPDQHARGGRGDPGRGPGRHGVTGAPAAGRPAVAEQGPRRPRAFDQHLHCLQPGLPGPCVREQAGQLPGQPPRGGRDRTELPAGHHAEADRRGRCRPGRAGLRHGGGRARACGDPVRCGRPDRWPVQPGQAHPR